MFLSFFFFFFFFLFFLRFSRNHVFIVVLSASRFLGWNGPTFEDIWWGFLSLWVRELQPGDPQAIGP